MKLYLLTVIGSVGYDAFASMVVRAESIKQARQLAADKALDQRKVFMSAKHSTCEQLTCEGEPGVIITDYVNG